MFRMPPDLFQKIAIAVGLGQSHDQLSKRHQIGRGEKTVFTLHKKILDDIIRDTPAAARARAVVARRQSNWRR